MKRYRPYSLLGTESNQDLGAIPAEGRNARQSIESMFELGQAKGPSQSQSALFTKLP